MNGKVVNPVTGALKYKVLTAKLDSALITLTPFELTVGIICKSLDNPLSFANISTSDTEFPIIDAEHRIEELPIDVTTGGDV